MVVYRVKNVRIVSMSQYLWTWMYIHRTFLKCPYYGLWKVHILVLGVPNNRLTCMQGQKTLSLSYNMHLFLPYLLNDSQTIHSTINFTKPLLCVCLWAFTAPKAAPSGKEWICIFIQTNRRIKFSQDCTRNKWADNMLMFHVDINMKRLGICFKNDSFQ